MDPTTTAPLVINWPASWSAVRDGLTASAPPCCGAMYTTTPPARYFELALSNVPLHESAATHEFPWQTKLRRLRLYISWQQAMQWCLQSPTQVLKMLPVTSHVHVSVYPSIISISCTVQQAKNCTTNLLLVRPVVAAQKAAL